jgi:NAD(P)-dependent dehydrogenase (short-subunit alcohol dehydrogenase family)
MTRDVLVVIGVGGMGLAIARRIGSGKAVVLADFNAKTLDTACGSLRADGHDVHAHHVDVSSAESVRTLAREAASLGPVTHLAHTAGLSPSQGSAQAILAVDLLGVAVVLQEFADVMAPGGAGVVVASMAGHLVPALTRDQQQALVRDALASDIVGSVTEPGQAYAIAKHANLIQVRAAGAAWGRRGARINSISPGIISTPMGQQELDSPLGDGMRAMLAASPAGRMGTSDDIAAAAEFLLGPGASFITGTDLLVDGGVMATVNTA